MLQLELRTGLPNCYGCQRHPKGFLPLDRVQGVLEEPCMLLMPVQQTESHNLRLNQPKVRAHPQNHGLLLIDQVPVDAGYQTALMLPPFHPCRQRGARHRPGKQPHKPHHYRQLPQYVTPPSVRFSACVQPSTLQLESPVCELSQVQQ